MKPKKTLVVTQESTNLVLAEMQIDDVPSHVKQLRGVKVYIVDVPIYQYKDKAKYLLNVHGGKDGYIN